MILGYRLRELRKEKMMSQEQLGKALGVTKVSISGYESGNRVPCVNVFNKMLDIFGVTADYLLGRELDVVCETNSSLSVSLSTTDIEIIRAIRKNPCLYNNIACDPRRYFSILGKKIK